MKTRSFKFILVFGHITNILSKIITKHIFESSTSHSLESKTISYFDIHIIIIITLFKTNKKQFSVSVLKHYSLNSKKHVIKSKTIMVMGKLHIMQSRHV